MNTPSASSVASRFLGKTAAVHLGIGDTIEAHGMRIHRYRPSLRVTDLTFAGKRGKRCLEFDLWDLDMYRNDDEMNQVYNAVDQIANAHSYAQAVQLAQAFVKSIEKWQFGSGPKFDQHELRGVDVKPAGFRAIEIHTDEFWLEADADRFSIRDLKDRYNEPTCISRGRKGDVNTFYRWVSENEPKIRQMTYNQIVSAMMDQQIQFHSYCSVD